MEIEKWGMVVRNTAAENLFGISSYGSNITCIDEACRAVQYDLCFTVDAITRIQGTTSITVIPLNGGKCDSATTGTLRYHNEIMEVDRATITMGTRTMLGDHLPPNMTWTVDVDPMGYFTCSGVAEIHTVTNRWFLAAWLFRYDPAKCDKPCWMAASGEQLPVQFGMVELPGEPGK